MIEDATTLQGPVQLRTDVCVVGSGAGGSVVAYELAAAGLDVVVVEEGHLRPVGADDQGQRTRLRERGLLSTADRSVSILQGRMPGGSTRLGARACWRTPDAILDEWAATTGVDTLGAGNMGRLYERVDATLSPTAIRQRGPLCDAAAKLGWQVGSAPILSAHPPGGSRLFGGEPAWRDAYTAWLEPAASSTAQLLCDCRAEAITFEDDRAVGILGCVLHGDLPAHKLEIKASAVVMAGGAIHSTALLQASRAPDPPPRLLQHGLQLQPTAPVFGVFAADPPLPSPAGAAVTEFLDGCGPDPRGLLLTEERWPASMLAATLPHSGGELRQLLALPQRIVPVTATVRDRREGRVVPMPSGRPVIRYELAPGDRKAMADGVALAARALLAAGADEVWTSHIVPTRISDEGDLQSLASLPYRSCHLALTSTSPLGTCAMGSQPDRSVTDGGGRVHVAQGLYVADASLLPTAPGVPLGTTVSALAFHVADTIRADLTKAGALGL